MKKLKGYICGTTPTDVNLGANDMVIFSSVKALKKARTCWKECGILEINLDELKYKIKPKKSPRTKSRALK